MAKRSPKETADYEIGYCKPPKEHQFKKGDPSPWPGGRTPGSGSISALFRRLCEEVAASDADGNPVTKLEFLLQRLAHDASKGKQGMMKMALQVLGAFDPPPPPPTPEEEVVEVIEVTLDFDNEKPLQPLVLTSNDAWAHLAIRGPNDPASDPPLSTEE